MFKHKYHHATPVVKTFQWLPIALKIKFKPFILAHRPKYLALTLQISSQMTCFPCFSRWLLSSSSTSFLTQGLWCCISSSLVSSSPISGLFFTLLQALCLIFKCFL